MLDKHTHTHTHTHETWSQCALPGPDVESTLTTDRLTTTTMMLASQRVAIQRRRTSRLRHVILASSHRLSRPHTQTPPPRSPTTLWFGIFFLRARYHPTNCTEKEKADDPGLRGRMMSETGREWRWRKHRSVFVSLFLTYCSATLLHARSRTS